jgi:transposase-like protein
MDESNRIAALFTDRKISVKVGMGFACVLAILAAVSGTAYVAFRSSDEGFSAYAQRVMVVGIARDVDRSFLNLRRFVREYASSGLDADVDAAKQEEATLRALLRQGLEAIKDPDRLRRLEEIERSVNAYLKDFGQVVVWTQEKNT